MERKLADPWTVHDPNFEIGFAAMMRRVTDGRQEDASDAYRGTLAALADREELRGQGLDDRVHQKRRIEVGLAEAYARRRWRAGQGGAHLTPEFGRHAPRQSRFSDSETAAAVIALQGGWSRATSAALSAPVGRVVALEEPVDRFVEQSGQVGIVTERDHLPRSLLEERVQDSGGRVTRRSRLRDLCERSSLGRSTDSLGDFGAGERVDPPRRGAAGRPIAAGAASPGAVIG